MGTPEAAVPTLRRLADAHEVALVVTQPDRPQGRSKKPKPSPVKTAALELGLEIAQPGSHEELKHSVEAAGDLDVGVVVAYGRILRPDVLSVPARGLLNVHFSLLPRWRGAAPVARALMAGDQMTGVSIIRLDDGLDTGPVLTAQAIDIAPEVNAGNLTEDLADLGARLLTDVLESYVAGNVEPVQQSDEGATYANKIERDDRPINPAEHVARVMGQIRGLSPDPSATLTIGGEPHKIIGARPSAVSPPQGQWQIIEGIPIVGLSDGGVEIVTIQPPGKKVQSGKAWANGRRDTAGTIG